MQCNCFVIVIIELLLFQVASCIYYLRRSSCRFGLNISPTNYNQIHLQQSKEFQRFSHDKVANDGVYQLCLAKAEFPSTTEEAKFSSVIRVGMAKFSSVTLVGPVIWIGDWFKMKAKITEENGLLGLLDLQTTRKIVCIFFRCRHFPEEKAKLFVRPKYPCL